MELLGFEKEALGLYLSGHPIDRHADDLRAFGARTVGDLTLGDLPPSTDGSPGRLLVEDVHVGGIVSGLRPLKTKKGDPMCVFTLEDHQGAVEVVVFPETYARFRAACENDALLLVRGQVRARRGVVTPPGDRGAAALAAPRAAVARCPHPIEGRDAA